MDNIKAFKLTPDQYKWITQRVFHEPLGWQKHPRGDGMYMEDLDLQIQMWAHADGSVEITTWND